MDPEIDDNDHIEAEPLLAGEEQEDGQSAEYSETQRRQKTPRRCLTSRLQAKKPSTIITLLALLMFSVALSGLLFLVPMFRLMEDAICHVHYEKELSEPIEEKLCKVDEVQKYLAYLGGWSALLNSIIGMIAVLPYGVMADR